jgi:recombinational DNA repair ATPase RecF
MSTYTDYLEAVRAYLRKENATKAEKTKSSREIVEAAKANFDGRLSENSLYNYLNHAAQKDNNSGVISLGPHRGY